MPGPYAHLSNAELVREVYRFAREAEVVMRLIELQIELRALRRARARPATQDQRVGRGVANEP